MKEKPQRSLEATYEKFSKSFLERLLPKSMRRAKVKKFKVIKQTSSMTVVEYDI